ncbi:hypothetical protein [Limimaricola soesokkakensis]|uniref:hypothetical protein n=1 Tax=Limimaricola soesokkakensis TaxID=1343159 RepID=UPI003511F2C2
MRIINSRHPGAKPWTVEQLRRGTARFVKDGLPDRSVLDCASPAQKDDRIPAIIESSAPGMTLKQIAAPLEVMQEPAPWRADKMGNLFGRASAGAGAEGGADRRRHRRPKMETSAGRPDAGLAYARMARVAAEKLREDVA